MRFINAILRNIVMKIFTIILLLLGLNIGAYGQGIEFFEGTWQEALAQAESEEKLVFIDAYTTWCGPCKKMSANTFTDESVGAYFNNNFISMKIDMEKPMGREFGSKYPVSAYPTLFFLDDKGEIVKKSTGYKDVSKLISLGESVLGSADFSSKYADLYDNGDRSYDNVYKYISTLQKAGKPNLKIANEYLDSEHSMTIDQEADFVFIAMTDADSRIFDLVMEKRDNIIKLHSVEDFNKAIQKAAMRTTQKAIDNDYPVLIDETTEKLKAYDKEIATKYHLEAMMEYAGAYDNYSSFKKMYSTYYKKYGKSSVDACYNLNKLLNDHFLQHPNTKELQLVNLEQVAKIEPTEKSFTSIVSFLAGQKRYEEAYDVCKKAKETLVKKEIEVTQLEKQQIALEKKINM